MLCRRRLIQGIIGTLFFAGVVRADMVSDYQLDAERQQDLSVCGQSEVQPANLYSLYDSPIFGDFDLGTIQLQPEIDGDIEQPAQAPYTIELSGGTSSVNLCLYALMSLGLSSAPHWIKRLSLGHLPEWYHDGGPFQIGHSFATTPESLCALQVCYLVPPDETAEDSIPQHRQRTVISLWRKSQFTLDVIASRGPPPSIHKG